MEVPIVWRNDPRSHVRLVSDSLGMRLDLGRIRVNSWTGRYALGPGHSVSAPDGAS